MPKNPALESIEHAAKAEPAQLASAIIAASSTVRFTTLLDFLKSRKILTRQRSASFIRDVAACLKPQIGILALPDRDSLQHHIYVCTRLQTIFADIDRTAEAVPALRANRYLFRKRLLEAVELTRAQVESHLSRVDTEDLSARRAAEGLTALQGQLRRTCDAVNILISKNNEMSDPCARAITDAQVQALIDLAVKYDIVQGMFDGYSFGEIDVRVKPRSTVFEDYHSTPEYLANHFANIRHFSANQLDLYSYRRRG